jgi:hypothetical protein
MNIFVKVETLPAYSHLSGATGLSPEPGFLGRNQITIITMNIMMNTMMNGVTLTPGFPGKEMGMKMILL